MKKKILQAFVLGGCSTALAAVLWLSGAINHFEYATWNWRVTKLWRPSQFTSKIKVILIDQASLDWAAKENGLSWPWIRQAYGPVIDFCRRAGVRSIAFDMLYSEPSGAGVEDDLTFGAKIGEKKDFVLAFFMGKQASQAIHWPVEIPRPVWTFMGRTNQWPGAPGAAFPVKAVATNVAMLASVAEEPDDDGVFRRVTPMRVFDGQPVPVLGMSAWLNFQSLEERVVEEKNGGLRIGGSFLPFDKNKRTILRFRGRSGTHQCYSAAVVIRSELQIEAKEKPQIDPAELKDCYIFFGISAPGLKDLKPTPAGGDYPGVEIHATFLDNLLEGDFMRDPPRGVALAVVLLLSIAAAGGALAARNGSQTAIAFAGFLAIPFALGYGLYSAGIWWPMVFSGTSIAVAITSALAWNYATEGKQKRFIKSAFKQYLSGDVIDQMLANPGRLQLGGEKRELTMFFSDLKGFSSFSEKLDPPALTSLMNDVLSDACDVIFEEGGTVDKFIGDAIVAFWNAPMAQADHALRAVRTTILIQRKLDERRAEFEERTLGLPMRMRIGLNSGEVIVGNMGSRQRFAYTMLGDAANLAARLEGANKPFGTYIMVAENTWSQLNGAVPGREIGFVRVVGRAQAVKVFEPLGLPGEPMPPLFADYPKAMQRLREKKWAEAHDLFANIKDDPLSRKYAERCAELRDGKMTDWDGIWNLTEKG